jgi:hypothetical protein
MPGEAARNGVGCRAFRFSAAIDPPIKRQQGEVNSAVDRRRHRVVARRSALPRSVAIAIVLRWTLTLSGSVIGSRGA